ncbi:MAG: MarR family transcriptional regulator [Gemmatimonadales bacterium]
MKLDVKVNGYRGILLEPVAEMDRDTVDRLSDKWGRERPDLDVSGLGITSRISLLCKVLSREDSKALGPLGLAPWAADVLLALRRQGPPYQLTPTDLSNVTLLTSGAMTTRLDRLEAAGYVRRNSDTQDRRSIQVVLTETGVELADRAIAVRLAKVETILAPLSEEERDATARSLRKLLLAAGST